MAKIRVYELAKELGKDNKEMETVIRGLGVEIKGVMSTLDDDQAQAVRRHLSSGSPRREPDRRGPAPSPSAGQAAAQPTGPAVIRRRGIGPRPSDEEETAPPPVSVRPERPFTPDRMDRPERPERPFAPDRPERAERPERPFMAERPFAPERQPPAAERPFTPDRAPQPPIRRPVAPSAPASTANSAATPGHVATSSPS